MNLHVNSEVKQNNTKTRGIIACEVLFLGQEKFPGV